MAERTPRDSRAFIAERPAQTPFTEPLSADRANELWEQRQRALDDRDAAVAALDEARAAAAAATARLKPLEAQLAKVTAVLEKNRGSVSAARLALAVLNRGGA